MIGIGSDKIRISVMVLLMLVKRDNAIKLMQWPPGIVKSHMKATGVHSKPLPKMEMRNRMTLSTRRILWQMRHFWGVASGGNTRR